MIVTSSIENTTMQTFKSRSSAVPSPRTFFTQCAFASTSTASTSRRRRAQQVLGTDVDLIAPYIHQHVFLAFTDISFRPDPLSFIRPIIYASTPPRRQTSNSPYSTGEFPYSERDAKLEDLELEWRLMRERVDMSNHRFWVYLLSIIPQEELIGK